MTNRCRIVRVLLVVDFRRKCRHVLVGCIAAKSQIHNMMLFCLLNNDRDLPTELLEYTFKANTFTEGLFVNC